MGRGNWQLRISAKPVCLMKSPSAFSIFRIWIWCQSRTEKAMPTIESGRAASTGNFASSRPTASFLAWASRLTKGRKWSPSLTPDLFQRAGADYAALGHIHSARTIRLRSTSPDAPVQTSALVLSYPGSARVCRRGETGPRSANMIEVGENIRETQLVLKSAGQYREILLDVGLDGAIPNIEHLSREWVRVRPGGHFHFYRNS